MVQAPGSREGVAKFECLNVFLSCVFSVFRGAVLLYQLSLVCMCIIMKSDSTHAWDWSSFVCLFVVFCSTCSVRKNTDSVVLPCNALSCLTWFL